MTGNCFLKYLPGIGRCLMVGWGFAFGRGFVVLLWSIVWAIVAGIIGVLVIGGVFFWLVSYTTPVSSDPSRFLTAFFAASVFGILLFTFFLCLRHYAAPRESCW